MNPRFLKYLKFILLFNVCAADVKNILTEDGPSWSELMPILRAKTALVTNKFAPYFHKHYPHGNVSEKCDKILFSYANGIKEWKGWVIRMLDASGKVPSTVLSGTMMQYGSFDDCMNLQIDSADEVDSFKGQFCVLGIKSPRFLPLNWKTSSGKIFLDAYKDGPKWFKDAMTNEHFLNITELHFGICLPSLCSEEELLTVASALTKPLEIEASLTDCQTNESGEWPLYTKVSIYIFICLFGLCIFGTIKDKKNKDGSSSSNNTFLRAFSLKRNAKKVFVRENKSAHLNCLHGLKVMIYSWIILVHVFSYSTFFKEKHYTNFYHVFKVLTPMMKLIDSDDLVIDGLFLISGFLLVYKLWPKCEKSGGYLNFFQHFFEHYFRLTPALIFTIIFSFTLSTMYAAPAWKSTWEEELGKCEEFGWKNLLYIQNLDSLKTSCWPHTWYLAVTMQHLIFSLLLMIFTCKNPKFGISLALVLLYICIYNDYQTSIENKYTFMTPQSFRLANNNRSIVSNIYIKPFHHFSANLIGMGLGWIVLKHKGKQLSKFFHMIGWILCVGFKVGVIYFMNYPINDIELTALYNSTRNTVWSLTDAWIIYACTSGSVRILEKVFSLSFLVPLSKLSFCAYLLHPLYLVFRDASLKERIYMGIYTQVIEITAAWYYSYLLAFVAYIMAEAPINNILNSWYPKEENYTPESSRNESFYSFGEENHCNNKKETEKEQ